MRRFRSADSKRISPLKAVCQLEDLISTVSTNRHQHFHYVSFPAEPGIQACLTVIREAGKPPIYRDSLALIPNGVRVSKEENNPIYSNFLALIEHTQRNEIARLNGDEVINEWSEGTVDDFPFSSPQCQKLRESIDQVEFNGFTAPKFKSAFAALQHASNQSTGWILNKWKTDADLRENVESKRPKNWWVLQQWAGWESTLTPWYGRLTKYHHRFRISPPYNRKSYKDALNAFQKKCCETLRLKCSVKATKGEVEDYIRTLTSGRLSET